MSDLEQLLERVRAAKGADREIDGDIAEAFEIAPSHLPRVTHITSWLWAQFVEPDWETWEAPAFTSSIDAALELVERKLPGWFGEDGRHTWGSHAILYTGEGSGRARIECYAPTRPLAILAALLSALIAQRATLEEKK
jgi:hypothetical protein